MAECLDAFRLPLDTPGGQLPCRDAAPSKEDQHECHQCLDDSSCDAEMRPRSEGNEHHCNMVALSAEGVGKAGNAPQPVGVTVAHKGLHGYSGHADKSYL